MAKTLRGRVTWFVTLVIIVPLLAGALLLQRSAQAARTDVPADVGRTTDDALDRLDVVQARIADEAELIAERDAAAQVRADRPNSAAKWLREQLAVPGSSERADFAVIVRRDRTALAMAVAGDVEELPATEDELAAAVTNAPPPGLLTHTRALWPAGQFAGWLVTGRVIDADLLAELPAANVALLERDQPVATTTPVPADLPVPVAGRGARGRWRRAGRRGARRPHGGRRPGPPAARLAAHRRPGPARPRVGDPRRLGAGGDLVVAACRALGGCRPGPPRVERGAPCRGRRPRPARRAPWCRRAARAGQRAQRHEQ